MRRLMASEDGSRTSAPNAWTDVDVRNQRTIEHERDEMASHAHACDPLQRGSWRNRVYEQVRKATPLADYLRDYPHIRYFRAARAVY